MNYHMMLKYMDCADYAPKESVSPLHPLYRTFRINPLVNLHTAKRNRRAYILGEVPVVKSAALRRNTMKSSTRDKAEGTFHEAKGKAKEMAGKITDNPKLEAKGKAEKIAGKVQGKVGQVKKVLGK